MTYDWGYVFGPPMAVAPVSEIQQVLNFAVSAIPPQKILMGSPLYGHDWQLPYRIGQRARTLSHPDAVSLAREMGAIIEFDQQAMAPYFNYYDTEGNERIVWFEDARSILAKFKLIDRYNLKGIAYWQLALNFPQNWLILNYQFNIKK